VDPVAIAFGVTSALAWGIGDFAGGVATRKLGSLVAAAGGSLAGVVVLVALVVTSGESRPSAAELGWAMTAGAGGGLGLAAFYRALAGGQMGLVAPVSGALGAAIPVAASVAFGESIGGAAAAGVLCGLAAIVVVSLDAHRAGDEGFVVPLVIAAGIGFAIFFVAIDRAASEAQHVWTPLLISRTTALTLFVALLAARRRSPFQGVRRYLPLIALVGLADLGGNVFFVLADHRAPLSIAVVLASLYPVVTALLAWVLLGERLRRIQVAGAGLAVVAIVLMSI
jgi:drug/metabolite transporter (DMT)-like permease